MLSFKKSEKCEIRIGEIQGQFIHVYFIKWFLSLTRGKTPSVTTSNTGFNASYYNQLKEIRNKQNKGWRDSRYSLYYLLIWN